jgi:hypothetical protein
MRMQLKSEAVATLKHRREALLQTENRFPDEERLLGRIEAVLTRLKKSEDRYFDAAGYDFLTRARIRKATAEAGQR